MLPRRVVFILGFLLATSGEAGPFRGMLETEVGMSFLRALGLGEASITRVLGDLVLIERLGVLSEYRQFRESFDRFQQLTLDERIHFERWVYSEPEEIRNAIYHELGGVAECMLERVNSSPRSRLGFTSHPRTLTPGSVPGRIQFSEYWRETEVSPLTYSYDSEIPRDEVIRLIQYNAGTRSRFESLLQSLVIREEELLQGLNFSSLSQLRAFALRRSAQARLDPVLGSVFTLNDLFPRQLAVLSGEAEMMRRVLHRADVPHTSTAFERILVDFAQEAFTEQGLRVRSKLDGNMVELNHATFEQRPAEFRRQVENLHSLVSSPATHLHLGIPDAVKPWEDTFEIAKAIEARLTIALMIQTADGTQLPLTHLFGSTMREGTTHSLRGLVRATLRRFSYPRPTHDIEIRKWRTIEEGMELMGFGASLAREQRRMRKLRRPHCAIEHVDALAGDVAGTIDYVIDLIQTSEVSFSPQLLDRLRNLRVIVDWPGSWMVMGPGFTGPHRLTNEVRHEVAAEFQRLSLYELLGNPLLYLERAH